MHDVAVHDSSQMGTSFTYQKDIGDDVHKCNSQTHRQLKGIQEPYLLGLNGKMLKMTCTSGTASQTGMRTAAHWLLQA